MAPGPMMAMVGMPESSPTDSISIPRVVAPSIPRISRSVHPPSHPQSRPHARSHSRRARRTAPRRARDSGASSAQHLSYPVTRRSDHVDTPFGTKVADPYRWVEAQSNLTFGYLAGFRTAQRCTAVSRKRRTCTHFLSGISAERQSSTRHFCPDRRPPHSRSAGRNDEDAPRRNSAKVRSPKITMCAPSAGSCPALITTCTHIQPASTQRAQFRPRSA